MKANLPKSWFSLPEREKKAIADTWQQQLNESLDHEEAELQKAWLQLACIVLHNSFGFGERRCMQFLGNWKRMYHICSKFKTNEERDEYLAAEMAKIFTGGGYPYEWVDSLENGGKK